MPKPTLLPEYEKLAHDIVETFMAGHKQYRNDLPYPQSHSDMMAGAHALIQMFEIKRRPLAIDLPVS